MNERRRAERRMAERRYQASDPRTAARLARYVGPPTADELLRAIPAGIVSGVLLMVAIAALAIAGGSPG